MTAPRRPRSGFFDVWSRFYDLPPVQRAIYRPVHEAVLSVLRIVRPRRILDVGCGTGLLTSRFDADTVVGCDYSIGMLEQASARTRAVQWVQGNAVQLPLRDASVEAVTSTESFHWFPDQAAALREFNRVLVPGGRVLVALVNPLVSPQSTMATWPTRTEMQSLFTDAGFDVADQRRIMRLFGVMVPTYLTVGIKS